MEQEQTTHSYAAIDLGSNAARLLIVDIFEFNNKIFYRKNTMLRIPIRLGSDVFLHGEISSSKQEQLLLAFATYRDMLTMFNIKKFRACATSAMRDAKNGKWLRELIFAETGIELEIIDGKTEANLIYSSHIERVIDPNKNYLYIDVGGGSTELTLLVDGKCKISKSFNLGSIRLLTKKDKDETWLELQDWLVNRISEDNLYGIGTGGNINTLQRLSGDKADIPLDTINLQNLRDCLAKYSVWERITQYGLKQDRADVIVHAADIFLYILKWAEIESIYVPRVGLVDGIIAGLIQEDFKIMPEPCRNGKKIMSFCLDGK